jgi:hypothetical protein
MSQYRLWLIVPLFVLTQAAPSFALPTMVRLGYKGCAACHMSPQGGGLLTDYGKGIDTAQSLRRREVEPNDKLRRVMYDVRFVMGASMLDTHSQAQPVSSSNFRFMLRSAVQTSARTRVSYQAGLETPSLTRSNATGSANFVVSKALFEYQPKDGIQIAVGRDTLPNGLGLPDPQTFSRRQHDPLGTGYPTQIKAFFWNDRFEVVPYAFGPGFDEARELRQHGAGILAGVDVWKQHAVVGMTARQSSSDAFDRRSVGAYARVGFGRFGVLAEHDLTTRVTQNTELPGSEHIVGFTQFYFAPVEWFVTYLSMDNVTGSGPGAKRTVRFSPSASMRLSDNLTVVLSTRDEFANGLAPNSRAYSVSFAVKTIQ